MTSYVLNIKIQLTTKQHTAMTVNEKIAHLRKAMDRAGISAYIITSSDAHLSEYTPERWKGRTWISGFDGSAGTVVITKQKAGLWTDSRYFLQANEQLAGSKIALYKQGIPGTPSIEQFISSELEAGEVVGADGSCLSHTEAEDTKAKLSPYGVAYRLDLDLLNEVWSDRPSIPMHEIFEHPEEFSGQSIRERIKTICDRLQDNGANATIITMLDELAWTFNIRGNDVEYNPVALGFGFISQEKSVLFTLESKVPPTLKANLKANGVEIADYYHIGDFIASLPKETRLLVDGRRITQSLYALIPQHCQIIPSVSVITMLKAVKNETELAGLRKVMIRDGVALTRFFIWLEQELASGNTYTEYEIGVRLNQFRASGELFYGDSFATIAGYQGHGAIVHYRADEQTSSTIRPEGVLLLDSGGQYIDGTTDITRTIALSKPSEELRTDYTLVLKGHIGIATALYPQGTCGCQLDILARKALWDRSLNYGHGTGHGVGYFLNVHEGPQNIRTDLNPTALEIGMITSNEPGLYRSGIYGIRIENLIVTEHRQESEFGHFYGFETLTLCYMDNSLVDKTLMTAEEIAWYNNYQELVYTRLSPELSVEEAKWLRNKTMPI